MGGTEGQQGGGVSIHEQASAYGRRAAPSASTYVLTPEGMLHVRDDVRHVDSVHCLTKLQEGGGEGRRSGAAKGQ